MAETAARDRGEPGIAIRPFLMLLTRGYFAAVPGGALFAIAGIIVAFTLIRIDKSQVDDASAAPPAA